VSPTGNRRNWILFVLLGLIWGSSFLFIKIGDESLQPFTLVTLRLTFGTLFLGTVVVLAHEPLPRDWRVYRHLAVLGVLSILVPFALITWGERHIDSGLASILNSTTPLFTIVVAGVALHDEGITLNRVIGLLIGFTGVIIVASQVLTGGADPMALAGEVAVSVAALAYSLGAVYARAHIHGLRPMTIGLGQVGFGLVFAAVGALVFEHPFDTVLRPEALFSVAWLGILGSGLAYLIFFRLLAAWGATRTQIVTYLLPPVGVVLGVVVLGEAIDLRIVIGTALIVGGVAFVNRRRGSRTIYRRAPAPPTIAPAD
jgi:drug/metabolite transporter (DMT)-like permease